MPDMKIKLGMSNGIGVGNFGVLGGGGAAAPFAPTDITGLRLWLLADDIGGNDGDAVTTWTSKEGNVYAFTQSDANKKPLLKKAANGINGKNTVLFDGSNDLLRYAGNMTTASSGTLYIVLRMTAPLIDTQYVFNSSDEATTSFFLSLVTYNIGIQPNMFMQVLGTAISDQVRNNSAMAAATTYIIGWSSSGTAYTARRNGTSQTLVVSAGGNNGNWFGDIAGRDNVTLGMLKRTSEILPFKGDVAEVLLYDVPLDATQTTSVETYLAARYGVTLP